MHYFLIFLKGLCMGAADVVPGVSGGTVAFITGIYERLLTAISRVDQKFLRQFIHGNWGAAWKHIDGTFLLILISGIGTSFLLLARVVLWLMTNMPEIFWGGMSGLILASTVLVWRQLKTWKGIYLLPFLFGALSAFYISIGTPNATPNDLWFIFLSGMVAICAMILPGISGSFILVLLEKYEYMMLAIKELRFPEIIVFIAGCVVGLLSFARVLKFLFRKYHDITVMCMAGFMLGSLVKLWPWKVSEKIGEFSREINVSPSTYLSAQMNPHTWEVLGAFLLCFLLVLILEIFALKKST